MLSPKDSDPRLDLSMLDPSGPEVGVEAGFEPGDGREVRPGRPVEDGSDRGVVDAGQLTGCAETAASERCAEPDGEQAGDLGGRVGAGVVGPARTEVSGLAPLRSGHDHTVEPPEPASEETNTQAFGAVTPPTYLVSSNQRTGRVALESISEIVGTIVGYTPRKVQPHHWAPIEAFTKQIAAKAVDHTPYATRDLLIYLSQFIDWAHRIVCVELDERLILDPNLITRYCQPRVSGWSERTCENGRSVLSAITDAVVGERPDLETTHRSREVAKEPYTPEQENSLRIWARSQPTADRRMNARVIVSLCFGAGASSGEVDSLLTDDVDVVGDDVYVNFGDWVLQPRRVQIRAAWAEDIEWAKHRIGSGLHLFRSQRTEVGFRTKNSVGTFFDRSTRIRPRPRAERMRLTWIVRQVEEGVSPLTVLEQSGITGIDRIRRIVSAAPTLDLSEFHGRYRLELAERRQDAE